MKVGIGFSGGDKGDFDSTKEFDKINAFRECCNNGSIVFDTDKKQIPLLQRVKCTTKRKCNRTPRCHFHEYDSAYDFTCYLHTKGLEF